MRQQDMFNHAQPLEAWSQMWLGSLGTAQKAMEPMTKSAAAAQKEMLSLASRRAQAWLELPNQMAQCKSPEDYAHASSKFWQTAAADWNDATRRMMSLWSASLTAGNGFSPLIRDHMLVPDATDPRRDPLSKATDASGRRVAA